MVASRSPLLRARQRLGSSPLARWLISTAVCFKAPYFWSIRPSFLLLEPGRVEVWVPKRRAVTNHINTVHAIAMCNAAELAGFIELAAWLLLDLPSTSPDFASVRSVIWVYDSQWTAKVVSGVWHANVHVGAVALARHPHHGRQGIGFRRPNGTVW